MVIEESFVVVVVCLVVKFWFFFGGFYIEVIDMVKFGQFYFWWGGSQECWEVLFLELEKMLCLEMIYFMVNMEKCGGGIKDIKWLWKLEIGVDYFQLLVSFQICDSMGVNFINFILE